MIKNRWYVALESNELKNGKLLGVTRFGEKLVFYRKENGEPVCLFDKCIHRGASLAIGELKHDCVACPFHGFEYDETGKCILIPANGKASQVPEYFKVNNYNCVEKHGYIWIWLGDTPGKEEDITFFTDIDNSFSYVVFRDEWNVHYSRAIENQLDLVHIPFVHRKTIGKGNRTLVNGPVAKIEDMDLRFWVYNKEDDGTKPLKPEEVIKLTGEPSVERQHIHFIFPNIWQNYIFDKMRVLVAFVPVDEENTVIYLRYYQKIVTVPIIRDVFNFFGKVFSKKVLREDKRVVITQIPKKTDLNMDEKLIQGDLPIILYRKRRKELQDKIITKINK